MKILDIVCGAIVILFILVLILCGLSVTASAADLWPDQLRIEAEHISHATQHEPFTDHPTEYRYDSLSLVLRWSYKRAYIEIAEGASVDPTITAGPYVLHGALLGPREVFHGRVGFTLWDR